VLVDIDPRTMCMDTAAVEEAITPATTAILVVHLYSAMADMDALRDIADRHGLPIIEDAAQAYGAEWAGVRAGSLGTVGAFSAQQGKTLTSGEGGLFVTSDPALRDTAELLRGDGRRYAGEPPPLGAPHLVEETKVQGWNMHLSEFQAAILLDGLTRLPEQNRRRAVAAAQLDAALAGDALEPIQPYERNHVRAYYHYAIRLRDGFGGHSVGAVCRALSAELGFWIHPPYPPLNAHPLFDPRRLPGHSDAVDPGRFQLKNAERESRRAVLLHHPMLLGSEDHLAAIVAAFAKIRRLASQLPDEESL
jgi:dTDP-4-amino-4,6-dideoxygalactose transaminase